MATVQQLSYGGSDGCQAVGLIKVVTASSPATVALTTAQSGGTFLFDRAAGIVYTLPVAVVGMEFNFVATVAVTSNAYKVITGAATELLIGSYVSDDTDSSDAVALFPANQSTHVSVSMNGTTTGGLIGTSLRFRCLTATKWHVDGIVMGNGTVANAFST